MEYLNPVIASKEDDLEPWIEYAIYCGGHWEFDYVWNPDGYFQQNHTAKRTDPCLVTFVCRMNHITNALDRKRDEQIEVENGYDPETGEYADMQITVEEINQIADKYAPKTATQN
jgi:hypothetical protein